MMRIILLALVVLHCGFSACAADLLDEIAVADRRADAAISEIRSVDELEAMQSRWLAKWIEGLGGFPDITPLNAKEGPVVRCDGFTLQNVLFESQPGVFVVGHLALPDSAAFKPPYPAVLMPMGHSDSGILAPRYAAHLAMMARAGFAAFSWDPIGQGERRQCAAKYDSSFGGCACEHTRLGFRGWLVGLNFASFRIWDGIRALDWLETRGDVDCSRVGVCGTSGGGTMSAYLQAIDSRIKVAFPNCFVSSIRSVFAERGCHDAEQFFWNQLGVGVNHAAILALGCPRVSLAVGSRWSDYFPHSGTVDTFAVHSNLVTSLEFPTGGANNSAVARSIAATALAPWHFHCAGPHGLPLPTRAAQRDWMICCIKDGCKPQPLAAYHAMSTGDHSGANDPCSRAALPFPTNAAFFTATRQVRDLKGFRSVYAILADRARELAAKRPRRTRAELREIVRRRAGIRPLSEIKSAPKAFDHPKFGWWYVKGAYGCRRENEAAMLSVLGRSVVGRDAERIIFNAAKSPTPTRLRASGWDCIAAAHAYAAEPQLFTGVEFVDRPPSWTEMVVNPDPSGDSFAVAVWGALKDYDWTDLVPAADEARLYDGHLDPTCRWDWRGKPIEIVTDFGGERDIGGVRFWAGRCWVSCGPKKASFWVETENGKGGVEWKMVCPTKEFRPAHTYKQSFALWPKVKCRRAKMVVEDAHEKHCGYYMGYMHAATSRIRECLWTPSYTIANHAHPKVEIAELEYFGEEPSDLPVANLDAALPYPDSRLVFDWLLQSCAVSNVSHVASVERDTEKNDSLGESVGGLLKRLSPGEGSLSAAIASVSSNSAWRAERERKRREFLSGFRRICDEFVYVKHLVIGNSIMHATDDMTDASFLEWRTIPDYRVGSQLIRAKINADGSVTQRVLIDEPNGIIRDPSLSVDAKYIVVSKRSSMTKDNYHLWRYDLDTGRLVQLTFEPTLPRQLVPGQKTDFPLICSDTEPCVLPDGSIVFQSTRVCHSVDCWPLPTTNLYRCDPDGSNIRRIGFDQIQTFYPQLMEDGRICYTRWEYQDRSASGLQQLYAMEPDGSRQMGFFGNNSEWPFSYIHCRSIPGSDKMISLVSGHHVAQKGKVVRFDPTEGDDFDNQTYDPAKSLYGINTNDVVMNFPGKKMVISWTQWDNQPAPCVTNVPALYYVAGSSMDNRPGVVPARHPREYHYNVYDMYSQFGPQWAYPFALSEDRMLVSYMPEGCRLYRGPYSSRFGVYAVDSSGRRELLAFDWGNHCMQPVALMPRPGVARRKVKKLDYTKGFGTYYIQDVYYGAAAKGLARGEVKKLRVLALEYRPVHNGWNWQYGTHSTQGKIGTPIAVGNGAYDVKHVLGEAEVEADGSCMFRCPARTPVYFQLIDKDGHCLQTMRSWSTLMPDESNSCIGCHEHPNDAAPIKRTIASGKPPQKLLSPIPGRPRHPYLERLEREGPLASLENWMGLNRPMRTSVAEISRSGIPVDERGDGFGFVKDVQPIFDRLMRECPEKVKALGLDLSDVPAELPPSDDKSMRSYSRAYLQFTDNGKCDDNINFAHGMGGAAFKPPKSFGSLRSKRYHELAPLLTDSERRTLAMFIDLCIPYCSAYTERHTWDAWHQQRYLYTYDKRIFSYWLELDEIRRSLGMESVALTGFVPNISEPRKQSRWDE